jgi:hypothetical protein
MGFLGAVEAGNQSWPVAPQAVVASTGVITEKAASVVGSRVSVEMPQLIDVPCPQNGDCPAGGFAPRIYECQEGCGFHGCAACMEIHESEPHLKQSPVPAAGAKIDWTKIGSAIVLAIAMPATVLTSGCGDTWERTTYATLATGKALIDCAVAEYNHFDADIRHACATDPVDPAFDPSRFYIAQTREAQQAIEKARQLQIACVEAFEGYAVARVGKDPAMSLSAKQAAVAGYLVQLPALLNAVRTLIGTTPSKSAVGLSNHLASREYDPVPMIATLSATGVPLRSPDHPIHRSPDFVEVSLGQ